MCVGIQLSATDYTALNALLLGLFALRALVLELNVLDNPTGPGLDRFRVSLAFRAAGGAAY